MRTRFIRLAIAITLLPVACSKSGKNAVDSARQNSSPYQAVVQNGRTLVQLTGISDATAQKMMGLVQIKSSGTAFKPTLTQLPIDTLARFVSGERIDR